jgi:catechol 2,3-dioxygenase
MSYSSNPFDIVRTSHVELLVADLGRSREFYIDTLGFVETYSDEDHIYLRGLEDRFHHCLLLTKSKKIGVGHISFRVRTESDLDKLEDLFKKSSLQVKWLNKDDETGQGRAIRIQDPFGFPVEFFKEMDGVPWLLQKFDQYNATKLMRIDHVNLLSPNVDPVEEWYTNKLGFVVTEYTEGDKERGSKIWATWLRRKPTVHDVAVMTGRGPRLHHCGFVVSEKQNILDCADVLASKGYLQNIERGPGRHGISNAFFLYLRDPDGHRVELYTGDYLSIDPEWTPLVWKLDDPQRQTFWGAPAPERWFTEASDVKSVFSGENIATKEPVYDPRKVATNLNRLH